MEYGVLVVGGFGGVQLTEAALWRCQPQHSHCVASHHGQGLQLQTDLTIVYTLFRSASMRLRYFLVREFI